MIYATLNNGVFRYAPRMLVNGNTKVFNPSDALYIEQGYLPVITTEAPTTDDEHYAVASWEEQNGQIVQVWSIEEMPINEEATITDYESALTDLGVAIE